MDSTRPREYIVIEGYTTAASHTRKEKRGGVCILVRNKAHIKFKVREVEAIDGDFEVCAVDIIAPEPVTVVVIYRTPEVSKQIHFLECLEDLLVHLAKSGRHILLCGDWNVNLLDMAQRALIEDLAVSLGYGILDYGVTRETNQTKSAIDVVMANWEGATFIRNIDPGLSVHSGQLVGIRCGQIYTAVSKDSKVVRRYTKISIQNFIGDFGNDKLERSI